MIKKETEKNKITLININEKVREIDILKDRVMELTTGKISYVNYEEVNDLMTDIFKKEIELENTFDIGYNELIDMLNDGDNNEV